VQDQAERIKRLEKTEEERVKKNQSESENNQERKEEVRE